MKISYAKLQEYFEDKLPVPAALAEAITFHLAEVETVEEVGSDYILDVKVLPDRAGYAKSYEGIAMEVSAILNLKRKSVAVPSIVGSRSISLKTDKARETLGLNISDEAIINILKNLDIGVEGSGGVLTLNIPENRKDIQDWRDIPEEIGRIYGYNKIPVDAVLAKDAPTKVEKNFYFAEKIKNHLVSQGFSEVYTYTLTAGGLFHIEKSVATDKNYLRTNLTDGIARALDLNTKNADLLGLDVIKVFEIGKVFSNDGERTALSIGIRNVKKYNKTDREIDQIKLVRDELLAVIDANATILCTVDDSGGLISVAGKNIGMMNNTDGIMELDLDALIVTLPEPTSYSDLSFGNAVSIEYKKFSLYPFIVRDIAVFVPVPADDTTDHSGGVWQVIEKGIVDAGASTLVVRHALFDTFKKGDKVSYAFRIIFQSIDRTLTIEETNAVMDMVNAEVKGAGWEVR